MSDHHDLPYRAEYAKSGRASCKACRETINKDALRLAIMVQSPHFDGKVPNWFHFNCFWKRARCTDFLDIHNFDSLRWEDQERVKTKIGGGGSSARPSTSGAATDAAYNEYVVEYAKSGQSKCRAPGCDDKIPQNQVRVSQKEYESQRAIMYGPQDLWHHLDCFVTVRDGLGFTADMDPTKMKGYKNLRKETKEELLEKLGKGDPKKRKQKEQAGSAPKKQKTETAEEKALKEQSKLLWKLRDGLEKDVSTNGLKGLLEFNGQELAKGESRLLDRVSDFMAFGVPEPCSECGGGQLVYSQGGYRCTGNLTEWTKCLNITTTPKRKPFKIPKEFHDVEFLKGYKYVKRDRVFPKGVADTGPSTSKPLNGMTFVISGKLSKSKADITKSLTSLGGSVASKVDQSTAAVISTKEEIEKMNKAIKDAKKHDIQVVDEGFVDAAQKGGAVLLITQHNIASWGADPAKRVGDVVDAPRKSAMKSQARVEHEERMFTKSMPSTMKMTVKGGAAVDPDSGLEHKAHVLKVKDELLTVVLGMVDITRGSNSYYKLQVLEGDTGLRWWVFRSWGRVGTTIGGNKVEAYGSKLAAMEQFFDLYLDKTGNSFENRKNFEKRPNKFFPIDIDHGADDDKVRSLDASAGSNSKLPQGVQDLVRLIFDIESMKKAMLEYEIDLKKMPLGKLSKKQIEDAYKVLTELNGLIETGGSETKFLDASNRFYTLIPHDFGMRKPPLLNNPDTIKSKIEMLDNLLDIEVAYSLMKGDPSGDAKDPIDMHYEKLKTEMEVLDKKSDEFEMLKEYVKNTHASTHNQYELEVQEVFKIKRQGEAKRYRPFRDLHNRMLLWHGSRTTNYAGILSQGLRIAPPEAPVTGYMFGKGVYFADMVSKSANYCRASKSDPNALMLLCEVALGNMYELTGSEYVNKLPKGKHSTKGIGMTEPDPKGHHTAADGLVIPKGKGQPAPMRSSLLYNEYIVYDVSQINMKYLLKMDFKFKW